MSRTTSLFAYYFLRVGGTVIASSIVFLAYCYPAPGFFGPEACVVVSAILAFVVAPAAVLVTLILHLACYTTSSAFRSTPAPERKLTAFAICIYVLAALAFFTAI